VDAIDLKVIPKSYVGTRVYTCDTKHLTINKIVKDSNGDEWRVVDIAIDEWVELSSLSGLMAFSADYILAPKPLFLHGTAPSVNSEYLQISPMTREKTPFIWLLSGYKEIEHGKLSLIAIEASTKLFFMDETDERQWLNDEHLAYSLKPMRKLADLFVKTIQKDLRFPLIEKWELTDRARFGVGVVNKGNSSKIIDEDLSGTQLDISVKIYKGNCKC